MVTRIILTYLLLSLAVPGTPWSEVPAGLFAELTQPESLQVGACYRLLPSYVFERVACTTPGAMAFPSQRPGPCYTLSEGEVPCHHLGAMTKDEYHRLIRLITPPEPQVTWLDWEVSMIKPGVNEEQCRALTSHGPHPCREYFELGLRDDGVVVWRKGKKAP